MNYTDLKIGDHVMVRWTTREKGYRVNVVGHVVRKLDGQVFIRRSGMMTGTRWVQAIGDGITIEEAS